MSPETADEIAEHDDSGSEVPGTGDPIAAAGGPDREREPAAAEPEGDGAAESFEGPKMPAGADPGENGEGGSPDAVLPPRRPRSRDLHPIGRRRLEDERAAFVPPAQLEQLRRRAGAPHGQIYVVHGAPGSGRSTVACNLALLLRPEVFAPNAEWDEGAQIENYFRDPNESRRLRAILEGAGRNRVVIVEDGGPGIFAELKSLQSSHLLADRGIDLILIADEAPHLPGVAAALLPSELGGAELAALLQKRLAAWAPGEELEKVLRLQDELISQLGSPRRVLRFSAELRQRWSIGDIGELSRVLVREIAHEERRSEKLFFERLPPSQRLAALLAGLFEGLHHKWLYRLLDRGIRQLRARGLRQFDDICGLTFEDLAPAIHVKEVEGGSVFFTAEIYRSEVARQLGRQGDWLFDMVEILAKMLLQGEADLARCQLVGLALARLGEGNGERLWSLIGELAGGAREVQRLTAAIALERFASRSREGREQAIFVLASWLEEARREPRRAYRLLSSMVFAAWRFFEAADGADSRRWVAGLLREAMRVLQQLQTPAEALPQGELAGGRPPALSAAARENRLQLELRAQLVLILLRSLEARPEVLGELLGEWLKSRRTEPEHQMARMVLSNQMALDLRESSLPEEALAAALLERLPALFSLAPGPLEFRLIRLCLHWKDSGLEDAPLLDATEKVLGLGRQARLRLLKTLLNWSYNREPDNPDAGGAGMTLAQRLAAALLISLGALLPAGRPTAVLLTESEWGGAPHRQGARLADLARCLFGGVFHLVEARLGDTSLEDAGSRFSYPRPQLMMPLLESLGGGDSWPVIVASPSLPHDLADCRSGRPLVVLSSAIPAHPAGEHLQLVSNSIQPVTSLAGFESFFDHLVFLFGRLAASWPKLAAAGSAGPIPAAWPERFTGGEGPGAAELCEAPPARWRSWLDDEESRLADKSLRLEALAASTARFQFLATLATPPRGLEAELLGRWAVQLVRADWQGTRAVLVALRSWLGRDGWRPLLVSPQGGWHYPRWFAEMPENQLRDFRGTLQRWLDASKEDEADGRTQLQDLQRRIGHLAEERTRIELPAAPQPYSLLVFVPHRRPTPREIEGLLEHGKTRPACVVYLAGRLSPIARLIDGESQMTTSGEDLYRTGAPLVLPILEAHEIGRLAEVVIVRARREHDEPDLKNFPLQPNFHSARDFFGARPRVA